MSLQSVAKQFVAMCNQGKNFDVMQSMYAPNIVSVENDGQETRDKDPVIEKSKRWAASNTVNSEKAGGPFFNGPNEFAVHYVMEITPKATGKRITIEEVGVYTVENDKITREQFFYDYKR
jgi:hypothetical protein